MTYGVIDSDIHPTAIRNLGVLMPYMPRSWQRLIAPRAELSLYPPLPGRAPRFAELLRRDAIPPSGGTPGSDPAYLSTHHMDRLGIELGLLLALEPAHINTWTIPDEAAVIATAANDFLAENWLSADDRFRIAMIVSPLDPHLAAKEIRRFGGTDGVCAVWLPLIQKLLGHRDFYPIYEAAQELALPIILHPDGTASNYVGCPQFAGGLPPTHHEQRALQSQFGMSNIANLIFEGVFERFRELKVVLAEYGWEWVAPLMWRLDSVWRMGRNTVPWLKRSPTEYLLDHIRFTSEPALEVPNERLALQILEMMNADRTMLFSSDYPHFDGDEPGRVFKSASPELRQRILRENAIETYGERLRVPVLVA